MFTYTNRVLPLKWPQTQHRHTIHQWFQNASPFIGTILQTFLQSIKYVIPTNFNSRCAWIGVQKDSTACEDMCGGCVYYLYVHAASLGLVK